MPLGEFNELYQEGHGEWKIVDFFSLSEDKDTYYDSPTFEFAGNSWYLRLYAGGEKQSPDGWCALFLRCVEIKSPMEVKYTFGFRKRNGKMEKVQPTVTHTFERESIDYGFFNIVRRSKLLQRKAELVPLDTLTITCILKHGTSHTPEEPELPIKLIELETLSKNFEDLLSNKKNSDATLKVKEKEFQVHKSVLVARSSVFAAMFQPHTLEAKTGTVSIEDCDPDSFGDFLHYLYTGKVDDIPFQNALTVYSTADKYDVQELKSFCVEYMKQNLTVNNVCDAYVFANQYDKIPLQNAVQSFFNKNLNKIAATTEWVTLLTKNCRLANKLILEMSSKIKVED